MMITKEKFEALFHEYFHEMGRYVMKFLRDEDLSEEIVQKVFIRLWERREKYSEISNWKHYLLKAVKNEAIEHLRKKSHEACLPEDARDIASDINLPLETIQHKELKAYIEMALKRLPESCYAVFALKRFEGLTTKETAAKLGISPKTVENQMTIAMRKIRDFLAIHDLP